MNTPAKTATMLFLASMVCPLAQAEETGLIANLGLQYKQLDMDQTFKGINNLRESAGSLKARLPVVNLQLVGYRDAAYASVKWEAGLAAQSVDSDIPFTTANTSLSNDVSRDDASITLGYKILESTSIFAGYMSGKTRLTPESVNCADDCPNAASRMRADGFGEYRQDYKEAGGFAGVLWSHELGSGRFGSSVAYARMHGKYKDNYSDSLGASRFDYQGDSTGLSAAVSWLAPLTENLAYFVEARVQNYHMDAKNASGDTRFSNSRVETHEVLSGIACGVQMEL